MPAETADAIVLGAGFVGVSAALHLQARGRRVALIDRHPSAAGETSFGNAGIVQTEAVMPYVFPRAPHEIARGALNLDPRAHIRYGALPHIAPSIWRYYAASTAAGKNATARAMAPLLARASAEHLEFAREAGAEALLRRGGWIKAFRSARGQDMASKEAEELKPYGIAPKFLDRAALIALEPHLSEKAVGGVHYADPLSTPDPEALAQSYAALFVKRGGRMETGDARTLEPASGGWMVKVASGRLAAPRRRDRARAVVQRACPIVRPPPAVLRQARLPHALRGEGQRGPHPPGARSRARLSGHADDAGAEAHDGRGIRKARRSGVADPARQGRAVCARALSDRSAKGRRALARPAPLPAGHAPGHRAVPGQARPLARFRPPPSRADARARPPGGCSPT